MEALQDVDADQGQFALAVPADAHYAAGRADDDQQADGSDSSSDSSEKSDSSPEAAKPSAPSSPDGSGSGEDDSESGESESSGSTSRSSSTSSSSSGLEGPGSSKQAPQADAGASGSKNPKREGVRRDHNSEYWGAFRFTPTKTGWQCTCPHHESDGKAHCTKTRSSNVMGSDMALRMLKAWALWGKDATSKDDHQQRIWKKVVQAQKDDTLPSMDSLNNQVNEVGT